MRRITICANEVVILSSSSPVEKGQVIRNHIMEIEQTPEEVQVITDHLASLDWHQTFEQRALKKQKKHLPMAQGRRRNQPELIYSHKSFYHAA